MLNLEHFKQKLEDQAKDIKSTIETMNKNRTADQDSQYPTELSNYDNHIGDMGTEVYMSGLNNALMVHQENLLKETYRGINKINSGTYGFCEMCGKKINGERLEAVPHTSSCVECERKKGFNQKLSRKSTSGEDSGISAPFGRKYLNKREDDEHEGLDYLNDLMKYGSSSTPQDLGGYHDYKEFYTNKVDKQGVVDEMDQVSNEEYKRQTD